MNAGENGNMKMDTFEFRVNKSNIAFDYLSYK